MILRVNFKKELGRSHLLYKSKVTSWISGTGKNIIIRVKRPHGIMISLWNALRTSIQVAATKFYHGSENTTSRWMKWSIIGITSWSCFTAGCTMKLWMQNKQTTWTSIATRIKDHPIKNDINVTKIEHCDDWTLPVFKQYIYDRYEHTWFYWSDLLLIPLCRLNRYYSQTFFE